MLALYEQIPRLRAERTMDAARAAVLPHLGKAGSRDWWADLRRQAERTVRRAASAVFTWNGVAITGRQLKRRVANLLVDGTKVDG